MSEYDDKIKELNNSNDVDFDPNLEYRCNNNNDHDLVYDENRQSSEDVLNNKHQHKLSNNYNPSVGNFRPYFSEEIENMIKTLKIDSVNDKISNGYPENTLSLPIYCFFIIMVRKTLRI